MNIDYSKKTLIAFDIDQTLTESRSDIDKEMSDLLCQLLKVRKIALIGGAGYETIERCVFGKLPCNELFCNAYNFTPSGTCFRMYENGVWKTIFKRQIPEKNLRFLVEGIEQLFEREKNKFTMPPQGAIVENRGSMLAVTPAGLDATSEFKKKWKKENSQQREIFSRMINDFVIGSYGDDVYDVFTGGMTTVDISEHGIDKGYAVKYIVENFDISLDEIVFIGDALQPGGNDYPVKMTGVETIEVKSVGETKAHIRDILNS